MEDVIRAEGKLLVASWARFCFGSSHALRARRPVDTLQSTRIGCGGLFLRKARRTPVVTRTPQTLWLRPNSQGRQGLGIAGHGAQDELVGVRGVLELVSPEMPPARSSSFADVNGHGRLNFRRSLRRHRAESNTDTERLDQNVQDSGLAGTPTSDNLVLGATLLFWPLAWTCGKLGHSRRWHMRHDGLALRQSYPHGSPFHPKFLRHSTH